VVTAKQASIEFALHWQCALAHHTDQLYFEKINFWRDFFPGTLGDHLAGLAPGQSASQSFAAGELVPAYDLHLVHHVRATQLHLRLRTGEPVTARAGRFYPRGMVSGLPDVFSGDWRPMRFLDGDDASGRVDLNHPLARYPLTVEGRVVARQGSSDEHGGRCHDIAYDLAGRGPGMQAAEPGVETDFYGDDPYARLDTRNDALFYRVPRLVQHLDSAARARVTEIYARLLTPGMRVLDLMSSWVSHLPEDGLRVTGLGLNAEELAQNPRLSTRVVHDVNAFPRLPFADRSFDAVVCTVSVEYLIEPVALFCEVARVLQPGAPFVLTFSERWFPPKVARVWIELHPFERLALVLDYFRRSNAFVDLHTESVRGLPRPEDDQYADQFALSDPVYAVWGRRVP
jgi:SAM-dependent methyltransferase